MAIIGYISLMVFIIFILVFLDAYICVPDPRREEWLSP